MMMEKRSFGSGSAIVTFFMVVLLFGISSVLYVYNGSSSWFSHASSILTSPSVTRYQEYDMNFNEKYILVTISRGNLDQHQKEKSITGGDQQRSISQVQLQISCDRSHYHYDFCSINGPTVLDPTTSTFYPIGPTNPRHFMKKIRPYPRKWENFTMRKIKEMTLVSCPQSPKCNVIHNTSAFAFSAGGYTGNFWHDFNDGFLPLFITIRSLSLSKQDVVLVIEKSSDWWVSKYSDLLSALSNYPIINLDNETSTHCFKSASMGLVSHGFMTINPKFMPKPTTLLDFHFFLSKTYGKAQNTDSLQPMNRPRLVLLSRSGGVGREILNEDEIKTVAENMGFDVIIFEPKPNTPLSETYGLMHESHVMMGVHGAALTHFLFLRPGSVFIQVVPLGIDGVAEMCFGKPAKELGLKYLEYKVQIKESSLVKQYNISDPILTDPMSHLRHGWSPLYSVYLKKQNVKLDLITFRNYLKNVYKMAKRFMNKDG